MRDWPRIGLGGVPPQKDSEKNEKGEGANPRSKGVAGERRGRGVGVTICSIDKSILHLVSRPPPWAVAGAGLPDWRRAGRKSGHGEVVGGWGTGSGPAANEAGETGGCSPEASGMQLILETKDILLEVKDK